MPIAGEAIDLQQNDTTWSKGDRVGPINELKSVGDGIAGPRRGMQRRVTIGLALRGAPGVSELEGKVSAIIMRCR